MRRLSAILFALLVMGCLAGCQRQQPVQQVAAAHNAKLKDSLNVVLLPTAESLPVYYAERSGIYAALGLQVNMHVYQSQLDCDAALKSTWADGGLADMERLRQYGTRAKGLKYIATWHERWQLLAGKATRVKTVKALSGRMVAIARQSNDNLALDEILQLKGLRANDVYRPQINDIGLRVTMLDNNQIDASMLRWPYTSQALASGHRLVASGNASQSLCWVAKSLQEKNSAADRTWKLFRQGYNTAVDSLNRVGAQGCRQILTHDYKLPQGVADTIKLPRLAKI